MLFPEKQGIKTGKASLSLQKEGYVKVVYNNGNIIDKKDYITVLYAVKRISKGIKLPTLNIYPDNIELNKEIIEDDLLHERKGTSIAEALVVKSFTTRFWINFYSGQNDGYPLRAFRNEESALRWLSGFLLN